MPQVQQTFVQYHVVVKLAQDLRRLPPLARLGLCGRWLLLLLQERKP